MDDMQEGLEAMQRDLEAILLMVAQDWRKFNKELEAFRRQSEKNPSSSADEAMGRVANLLGALRFYGLLIFDIDYEKKEIWEEHFVLPSSPVQRAVFVHLFQLYLLYRRTWEIINEGLVYSPLQADDLAKATCKMFIRAKLNEPYIVARTAEKVHEHFPNRTRAEVLSEVLVKYLATQLSLRSDWRLGRVLRRLMRNCEEQRRSQDRMLMHQTLSKGWCHARSRLLLGLIVRVGGRLVEARALFGAAESRPSGLAYRPRAHHPGHPRPVAPLQKRARFLALRLGTSAPLLPEALFPKPTQPQGALCGARFARLPACSGLNAL